MLPLLGSNFDPFYQAVVDQWGKEELSSQAASFLSGPSLNFSCRFLEFSTLFQVGGGVCFGSYPKMAMPSGIKVPLFDAIKSEFLARRKLANLLSVQPLVLFLQHCAENF